MVAIVGHRGAAGLEPENTILSFYRALDYDADELELDVRMSKDGEIVIVHDDTVDRTTNGHGRVSEICLADLRRMDAGKGEGMPTLYEFLWSTRSQAAFFNIEIKEQGCEDKVVNLVRQFADEKRTHIISFNASILRKVRKMGLKVGLGFDGRMAQRFEVACRLKATRIWPHKRLVTQWLVKQAHGAGMEIVAWTVNEPDEMRHLADLGVDGICTDYPDRAVKILRQQP